MPMLHIAQLDAGLPEIAVHTAPAHFAAYTISPELLLQLVAACLCSLTDANAVGCPAGCRLT